MKWNILALLMFLLCVGIASAAINTPTLTTPTTSGTLIDGGLINVSFTDGANITACAVFLYSSSTDNSSTSTVLVNISNSTATDAVLGHLNATFDDGLLFPDSNDYAASARCYESDGSGGGVANSAAVSSILVDRSVPSIVSLTNIGTTGSSSNTITFTVTNATSYTVTNGGAVVITRTLTGSATGSARSETIQTGASGTYYVTVSDGTNSTTSTSYTYTLQGRRSSGGSSDSSDATGTSTKDKITGQAIAAQQEAAKANGVILAVIIIVGGLLTFIVIYVAVTGKKGRR